MRQSNDAGVHLGSCRLRHEDTIILCNLNSSNRNYKITKDGYQGSRPFLVSLFIGFCINGMDTLGKKDYGQHKEGKYNVMDCKWMVEMEEMGLAHTPVQED